MVPQNLIVDSQKIYKITNKVIRLITAAMKNLNVELAGGKTLAEGKIQRGICQGDALLRLLFVITRMLLNHMLRKYTTHLQNHTKRINHLMYMYLMCFAQRLFSGLSGIRARRSMLNGRCEAERPPASAGQPSGERAAPLIPLSPLYITRLRCPVWAIIRHLCLDPDLGPCPGRLIRPTLH